MADTMKAEEFLAEAKNSLSFACCAVEDMNAMPVQASDLHRRWREYLANWSRCWDFIRKAANSGQNKALADSMKNRHKKHHVAKYLFQARDSDTHVGKVIEQKPTSVDVGSFATIESDNIGNIRIEDNYQIGPDGVSRPLTNFIGSIERGGVKSTSSVLENISVRSAYIELLPATNRSGTYAVPRKDVAKENRAIVVAKGGLEFLQQAYKEVALALNRIE